MRIMLIGVTGVLGRAAVPLLRAAGHEVLGLARDRERAEVIRGQGVEPVVADLFDADSLAVALRDCAGVLNLATRIPTGSKVLRPSAWRANDRVRRDGSTALVNAALRVPELRVIVQEGVSFGYADGGDRELDEQAPMRLPGMLRSVAEAHANVARFAEAGAGRVGVALRIGILLGPDPLTRTLLRGARWGVPLIFGDPAGWTTAIHPADAAAGAVAALGADTGVYNVGATPVRKRDLGAVLAEAAGVRKARHLPKSLAGDAMVFARSQRVVSHKLTEATGWKPTRRTPTLAWLS